MQSFIRAYIGEFSQMAINSPEMYTFYEEWVTTNFPDNSTAILDMVRKEANSWETDKFMLHLTLFLVSFVGVLIRFLI